MACFIQVETYTSTMIPLSSETKAPAFHLVVILLINELFVSWDISTGFRRMRNFPDKGAVHL